jgi:hypothetical protein
VLASAAIVFGAISRILHETDWTGLSQRLLWLTLMGWLLVTVWQLARQPTPHAQPGRDRSRTNERSDAT